jgi:hypothetical protein
MERRAHHRCGRRPERNARPFSVAKRPYEQFEEVEEGVDRHCHRDEKQPSSTNERPTITCAQLRHA